MGGNDLDINRESIKYTQSTENSMPIGGNRNDEDEQIHTSSSLGRIWKDITNNISKGLDRAIKGLFSKIKETLGKDLDDKIASQLMKEKMENFKETSLKEKIENFKETCLIREIKEVNVDKVVFEKRIELHEKGKQFGLDTIKVNELIKDVCSANLTDKMLAAINTLDVKEDKSKINLNIMSHIEEMPGTDGMSRLDALLNELEEGIENRSKKQQKLS